MDAGQRFGFRLSLHFSPAGYGAHNAPVAELARVPTNLHHALNSGEFSYE
jgi:hypothetical protein